MEIFDSLVAFLTARFPTASENLAFWMALQGSMVVRNGMNKDKTMHWFHAFLLSVVSGYGGSLFTPLWMGRPTSILTDDLNFSACIIAFVLVNYLPFDLGRKLGNFLPISIITVVFAQLFRTMGLLKYVHIAYDAFEEHPSKYYPTPVWGPILFATILGNMSSFFTKGFNGHLQNGMPWAFQNGFFCASLYHFFVNDEEGFIGLGLRRFVHSMPVIMMGLDERTFATVFVSIFMQICGLLQMPRFLGPSFSPFVMLHTFVSSLLERLLQPKPKVEVATSYAYANGQTNGPVRDYKKKKN